MRPLVSFTPNLRLARDSARSPNCSTTARPALIRITGRAGEIPRHAAVIHPVSAAQTIPPARPAQVFPGLQCGAKRGPPSVLPIIYAPTSVVQTTARTQRRVTRPTAPSLANHSRQTQGSATQSAPSAVHRGLESAFLRAVQNTAPAPTRAATMASLVPSNAAAATTARTTPTRTTPVSPKRPCRHSRPHSQAITAAASPVSSGNQGDPNQIAAIGSGPSTIADRIRNGRRSSSARANRGSVPSFSATIVIDRLFEIIPGEVGPQSLGKDELRIGALPKEKVADALLATGANQQVRVGNIRGK